MHHLSHAPCFQQGRLAGARDRGMADLCLWDDKFWKTL